MYQLILTKSERDAIDWVGGRYATGDDLANILIPHGDKDWDEDGDITFLLPESSAWRIQDLADEEEHRWPCFGTTLVSKLETFLSKIV